MKPVIHIEYCTQCRWQLRAAWMLQELLTSFEAELGGVMLIPGSGGIFRISSGDALLWDRATEGGFPELKTLKQIVRDLVAPERHLGHSESVAKRRSESSD